MVLFHNLNKPKLYWHLEADSKGSLLKAWGREPGCCKGGCVPSSVLGHFKGFEELGHQSIFRPYESFHLVISRP